MSRNLKIPLATLILGVLIGAAALAQTPQPGTVSQVVAFSTTPTFNASSANTFLMTLAGNVTSSTLTNGYSGREIERFCKEVTTEMVEGMNRDIPSLIDNGLDTVKKYKIKVRPLTREDFMNAARLIHPQTTPEEMQKYFNWKESAEDA